MSVQNFLKRTGICLAASLFAAVTQAADCGPDSGGPARLGSERSNPREPTPYQPGTTVGEQRFNAFQAGAQKWGDTLESDVPIFVAASFQPRPCSAFGGVLASAGPTFIFSNFPGAEKADTWYVGATADSLAGADLAPQNFDAVAFFNSELGTPGCLENSGWYYGLDGNEAPGQIDFLAVVTHELAHGLGFLELVDFETGEFFFGLPDIYSTFMLDTSTGKLFTEMTPAERLAAQVDSGDLAWSGENVTAAAPAVLGPRPAIRILRPKTLRGKLDVQQASFGPDLRVNGGITGQVVLANDNSASPTLACEPLVNNVSGKIVLIDRGGCAFTTKALNAQAAGAKGVIVANNLPEGPAPMGGFSPDVRIPAVGITLEQGNEPGCRQGRIKAHSGPREIGGHQRLWASSALCAQPLSARLVELPFRYLGQPESADGAIHHPGIGRGEQPGPDTRAVRRHWLGFAAVTKKPSSSLSWVT